MKNNYQIMKKNYQKLFGALALILCATFSQLSNAQCSGFENGSSQADPIVNGYNYTFTTVGTDVQVDIELLDAKVGLVAYVWNLTSGFQEIPMTNAGGQKFTKKVAGPAIGANFNCQVKFAYAGGMTVTKTLTYEMGKNCTPAPADTENPAAFTATIGTKTATSVELLLNATDDSGLVIYNITGGATAQVSGNSGTEKSYIISGLTPETAYNFSITAKDAAGNTAVNNPIALSATTLKDMSTACAGTSSVAGEGAFSIGYDYNFTTAGNDVTVHFKLLDTDKSGVVAYVFKTNTDDTNFSETGMGAVTDVTKTFSGLTVGDSYKFAIKFAYAGGMVVSKYFTYKVGDACTALGIDDAELSGNDIILYPNPVKGGIVNVEVGALTVSKVEVYSLLGAKVLETSKTAISTANLQAGIYFVKISAEGKSITKKLIVN